MPSVCGKTFSEPQSRDKHQRWMGKRQLFSGSYDFDEPQEELQAREEEGSFRLVDAVALQTCDSPSGVEFRPFGLFVASAAASSDRA